MLLFFGHCSQKLRNNSVQTCSRTFLVVEKYLTITRHVIFNAASLAHLGVGLGPELVQSAITTRMRACTAEWAELLAECPSFHTLFSNNISIRCNIRQVHKKEKKVEKRSVGRTLLVHFLLHKCPVQLKFPLW